MSTSKQSERKIKESMSYSCVSDLAHGWVHHTLLGVKRGSCGRYSYDEDSFKMNSAVVARKYIHSTPENEKIIVYVVSQFRSGSWGSAIGTGTIIRAIPNELVINDKVVKVVKVKLNSYVESNLYTYNLLDFFNNEINLLHRKIHEQVQVTNNSTTKRDSYIRGIHYLEEEIDEIIRECKQLGINLTKPAVDYVIPSEWPPKVKSPRKDGYIVKYLSASKLWERWQSIYQAEHNKIVERITLELNNNIHNSIEEYILAQASEFQANKNTSVNRFKYSQPDKVKFWEMWKDFNELLVPGILERDDTNKVMYRVRQSDIDKFKNITNQAYGRWTYKLNFTKDNYEFYLPNNLLSIFKGISPAYIRINPSGSISTSMYVSHDKDKARVLKLAGLRAIKTGEQTTVGSYVITKTTHKYKLMDKEGEIEMLNIGCHNFPVIHFIQVAKDWDKLVIELDKKIKE